MQKIHNSIANALELCLPGDVLNWIWLKCFSLTAVYIAHKNVIVSRRGTNQIQEKQIAPQQFLEHCLFIGCNMISLHNKIHVILLS